MGRKDKQEVYFILEIQQKEIRQQEKPKKELNSNSLDNNNACSNSLDNSNTHIFTKKKLVLLRTPKQEELITN